jgi:hypothetical protein
MGFSALPTALEQLDFIALAPVQHPLLYGVRFRYDPLKHRALGCNLLVGHHVPIGIEHRDFRPPEKVLDQHRAVALRQEERRQRVTERMEPESLDLVSSRVIRNAVPHGNHTNPDRGDRWEEQESIVVEEKTPPTATPDVAPRAAAPPASSWCPRCGVSGGKHANEPPDLVCPALKANGAKASIPCIACGKTPRRNPSSDYCRGCWDLRQPPKPERRGNDVGMPPQKTIPQPAWVDDVFD